MTNKYPEDLMIHRNDPGNMNLVSQSISMPDGHAGTRVTYYAALHQVIIEDTCYRADRPAELYVKRIDIPVELTEKSEILQYACQKSFALSMLLQSPF